MRRCSRLRRVCQLITSKSLRSRLKEQKVALQDLTLSMIHRKPYTVIDIPQSVNQGRLYQELKHGKFT